MSPGTRRGALLALTLGAAAAALAADSKPPVAFQGFAADLASLNRGLPPEAVAFHPQPGGTYGEAKFCMARYDNGYYSFVTFFSQRAIGITVPGAAVSVLAPDGKRWFGKHQGGRKEFSASTTGCDVRVGKDRIWGNPPTFQVAFDNGGVKLDLTYEDLVPTWQPGDGNVWLDGKQARYFIAVQAPWARVHGALTLDGTAVPVEGYGYCDQSFANILSNKQASLWVSFRGFPFPSTGPEAGPMVEFLEFVTTPEYGAARVPWLLVLEKGKILAATRNYSITPGALLPDGDSGYSYPSGMTVEVRDPGLALVGHLRTKRLVELADIFRDTPAPLRILAEAFLKRPVFYRLLADYEFDLTLHGEAHHLRGDAVTEWGIVK